MKEYITGIILASCVSGIIICLSPDSGKSGIGKYVKYIAAFAVLIVICTPLSGLINDLGEFVSNTDSIKNSNAVSDEYNYNASQLLMVESSADSIAELISRRISEKFCTSSSNVRVKLKINYGKISEVAITDAEILLYNDAVFINPSAAASLIESEFGFPANVYTGG